MALAGIKGASGSTLWKCGGIEFDCSARVLVMGVLNVTPDSFSDGGRFLDEDKAVEHGVRMAGEGADIIDVGGESSRPGADPVSAEVEAGRVVPVIRKLAGRVRCALSVDTTKAAVARAAVEAGARIVNDITALTADRGLLDVVKEARAGVVLMHMRGTPRAMQEAPAYRDVVEEVKAYLAGRLAALEAAGVPREAMVVDPGIGFGKTLEHNVELLRGLPALAALGRPVLVGLSRKSFIGKLTGREADDRLSGSLAAMACAIMRGARIVRVHDVKESCDAARVAVKMR